MGWMDLKGDEGKKMKEYDQIVGRGSHSTQEMKGPKDGMMTDNLDFEEVRGNGEVGVR